MLLRRPAISSDFSKSFALGVFNLNSAVKKDENGADTRKHKGF